MKYSIYCYLFGHKWYTKQREYTPAYLDAVRKGLIAVTVPQDYTYTKHPIPVCDNCGLSKKEVGIIGDKE